MMRRYVPMVIFLLMTGLVYVYLFSHRAAEQAFKAAVAYTATLHSPHERLEALYYYRQLYKQARDKQRLRITADEEVLAAWQQAIDHEATQGMADSGNKASVAAYIYNRIDCCAASIRTQAQEFVESHLDLAEIAGIRAVRLMDKNL